MVIQRISEAVGEWDILLQFILGVVSAVWGYLIFQKIKKAENSNELTLNVIAGVCFSV